MIGFSLRRDFRAEVLAHFGADALAAYETETLPPDEIAAIDAYWRACMAQDARQLELITTGEAAGEIGLSADWVAKLCKAGRVPAEKRGGIWWLTRGDAQRLADLPMGRPVTSGAGQRRRGKRQYPGDGRKQDSEMDQEDRQLYDRAREMAGFEMPPDAPTRWRDPRGSTLVNSAWATTPWYEWRDAAEKEAAARSMRRLAHEILGE